MERQIHQSDELSFKELILILQGWWKYLLSKWIIIVSAGIIGGLLGVGYATTIKRLYVAEFSFILEDGQSGGALGGYSGLASMMGIDLSSGSSNGIFVGDNLIDFMSSRSMIEKTLLTSTNRNNKRQTLAEFYIDVNKIREDWKDDPKLKNIYFSPDENRAIFTREKDSILESFYTELVTSNLSVAKKDKKLGIIEVKVKTANEYFSKCFAETLVKVVSDFYIETKTRKSSQNLAILQHQTDSIRTVLLSSISGVARSTDVNPNPNPARQVLRVGSQNYQVDVQTNAAILQTLTPNLEMAKVALRKETPLILPIDKPILPLKKEAYGKKKGLIAGGLLGGFLSVFSLIAIRIYKNLMT